LRSAGLSVASKSRSITGVVVDGHTSEEVLGLRRIAAMAAAAAAFFFSLLLRVAAATAIRCRFRPSVAVRGSSTLKLDHEKHFDGALAGTSQAHLRRAF
jgi:hypothetical protein